MKKVKIKKVPNMAWGGRVFNQVAPNALPYQTDEETIHYNDTLQPVPKEVATLEAEYKEDVLIPNYNGLSAKFKVGGKRHYEGGTPLNLPDNSFIYSDTAKMKIKDLDIQAQFGMVPKKSGYTPAEISKKYDVNKFRKILADPVADSIQKNTAEQMIENYNIILGKLALAQESLKGFPQGIPLVAEPYMVMNNLKPEDILPMPKQQGMEEQEQEKTMVKYGGSIKKVRIKALPRAQFGEQTGVGLNDQNILSSSVNEGQMVDIQEPMSFDYSWDTGQNDGLTFNSMVDSGFYEKPIEMGLESEKPGTTREVTIKEKNKKKRKYDFDTAQLMKQGVTSIANFNAGNQQDPMLAYRTMEDTMSGTPTNKGTFDPLNKNNFPDKGPYGVYDQFTRSAKYGGGLPKAQDGKEQKTDLMEFNQPFWLEYGTLGKSGAFVYDVPGVNFTDKKERERRATQSSRKDPNIYGDLDWNKGEEWKDFTRRHQWYLKDHPNFNPAKKDVKNKNGDLVSSDVLDFQKEYCKRAASYGMKSCYFTEGGKEGVDFDGKFGEHTWSAPGFNKPEETAVTTTPKSDSKQEDIETNPLQVPPAYASFEYYPQDVLNLMTAMGTQIPDPQTFSNTLAYQGFSPAFLKEDYSPFTEASAIATQGIGAYGSRQSADASYSSIQGKTARQAADHNLQVANINVGIYNDAEKFNSQMKNANQMYNIQQKEKNFDTEQALAAAKIMAKNKKRADVASMYNNMLTNAVDTYNLNLTSPYFKIHPGTGGMATFDQGLAMKASRGSNKSARVAEYESLIDDGYTHEQAIDLIGRQSGKADYPDNQNAYYNPYDYQVGPIT